MNKDVLEKENKRLQKLLDEQVLHMARNLRDINELKKRVIELRADQKRLDRAERDCWSISCNWTMPQAWSVTVHDKEGRECGTYTRDSLRGAMDTAREANDG